MGDFWATLHATLGLQTLLRLVFGIFAQTWCSTFLCLVLPPVLDKVLLTLPEPIQETGTWPTVISDCFIWGKCNTEPLTSFKLTTGWRNHFLRNIPQLLASLFTSLPHLQISIFPWSIWKPFWDYCFHTQTNPHQNLRYLFLKEPGSFKSHSIFFEGFHLCHGLWKAYFETKKLSFSFLYLSSCSIIHPEGMRLKRITPRSQKLQGD